MNTWQLASGLLVREDLVERESGLLVQAGTYKDPLPPIGFDAATVRKRYDPLWDGINEEPDPLPEPLSPLGKHYEAHPMDYIFDDILIRRALSGTIGPPMPACNHRERGMFLSICEGCNTKPDQTA